MIYKHMLLMLPVIIHHSVMDLNKSSCNCDFLRANHHQVPMACRMYEIRFFSGVGEHKGHYFLVIPRKKEGWKGWKKSKKPNCI